MPPGQVSPTPLQSAGRVHVAGAIVIGGPVIAAPPLEAPPGLVPAVPAAAAPAAPPVPAFLAAVFPLSLPQAATQEASSMMAIRGRIEASSLELLGGYVGPRRSYPPVSASDSPHIDCIVRV